MAREPWQITREMFLSLDEVAALRKHAAEAAARRTPGDDSPRVDRVIIETLLFSGLRNTEFCRLTLGDVDLHGSRPAFQVQGTSREEGRSVYLPAHVVKLLRDYVRDVRPGLLREGAGASDRKLPLLVNERGRAYERTALYRRVVRILTEAGLGARASVQLLRHTYGYLAYLRTGGNLLFCQRQLGHAHPMVTSVYAQFVDHSYSELAEMTARDAAESRPGRRRRAVSRS